MNNVLAFAQKGFVLDNTRNQLLTIKYTNSKYLPDKLDGKLALPGGQIDFGENLDTSFIREVEEETGITITPSLPFYVFTWIYNKEDVQKQIIATARLAYYKHGTLREIPSEEKELKIESVQWISLKNINITDFVEDEQPIIKRYFEYSSQNPFTLL